MSNYITARDAHPIDHLVVSSKRVADLRRHLLASIPRCPKHGSTLASLQSVSINRLFIAYLNWADRLIAPRPRSVWVWDGFWRRNQPERFADQLNRIISAVRCGEDLTPYLSPLVRTHGFAPRAIEKRGPNWEDKDLALNAYDVHHLHLVPANSKGKRSKESQLLLYVGVSRSDLLLVMIGDHDSFNDGTLFQAVTDHRVQSGHILNVDVASQPLAPRESQRLTRRGIVSPGLSGSALSITSLVASDGSSVGHVRHADVCCEAIESVERCICNRELLADELGVERSLIPLDADWIWRFDHCDLALVDQRSGAALPVVLWRR